MSCEKSSEQKHPCCIPLSNCNDTTAEGGRASEGACRVSSSRKSYKSMMVVEFGPHGIHAMASQDINAGTVIVQCLPLAHSLFNPPTNLLTEEEHYRDENRRCARCFFSERNVDETTVGRKQKFGRCSKCKVAFYCCRSCQEEDWNQQHKLECQYYSKMRKKNEKIGNIYATNAEEDVIPLLLRTFSALKIMRDGNQKSPEESLKNEVTGPHDALVSCGPDHFSSLMVSSEHIKPSQTEPKSSALLGVRMKIAIDLMEKVAIRGSANDNPQRDNNSAANSVWGYNKTVDDKSVAFTLHQSIERTLNAFKKNNFGIVDSLHSPFGEGVYPCAALLNHSCAPNCIIRYQLGLNVGTKYQSPILQIVACRNIAKGEELTHSYVDLALPTEERRARLMDTHGFECNCKRCHKNGCCVKLPENREDWILWPLKHKFAAMGCKSFGSLSTKLADVDLDNAIIGCQGLSENNKASIFLQAQKFEQNASKCMLEGNLEGELCNLSQGIDLFTRKGDVWFSPFHVQLYSLRGKYCAALLTNGLVNDAIAECEHIVSFLAVAFSHIKHHPLLGLQLFTLGDLYSEASFNQDSDELMNLFGTKAELAYIWAKEIIMVTHDHSDPMVKALEQKLESVPMK
ncbi:hypothetical protein ACHAXS_007983 [Conticribra weissflogii]